jgi:hypothetical protein
MLHLMLHLMLQYKKQKKMINLMQKHFDKMTDLFISGYLSLEIYQKIESKFIKDIKIFTVCMN